MNYMDAPVFHFKKNTTKMEKEDIKGIYELDTMLQLNPDIKLNIEGHRDYFENKNSISYDRAKKVEELLIGIGVESNRLNLVDYGTTRNVIDSIRIVNATTKDEKKLSGANRIVSFSVAWE